MSEGHWHDHLHEDEEADTDRDQSVAEAIWAVDNVELTTVGVDIGSATSHLMFSRLHLRRQAQGYSSRFVVVERQALHRSPIWLTPYEEDGLIDAQALQGHFSSAYEAAGLRREDVDAGAVILTGVALERQNARRIADLFADESGRFVCASAGHNLEALLAAHGSGSVARSTAGDTVLNVDVGGGTTKLAVCRGGQVVATMAIWGGARLIVVDDELRVLRAEPAIRDIAAELGIGVEPGIRVEDATLERLADAIAARVISAATGRGTDGPPLVGSLPPDARFDQVIFSGGVAEYLRDGADQSAAGDLGRHLAASLRRRWDELGAPVEVAPESIRATVIGASQFSLQLSGNTIHLSGPIDLPVHNVPVVAITLDDPLEHGGGAAIAETIERRVRQLDLRDREESIAIAISWDGDPRYPLLRAIADGVVTAHRDSPRRASPLMVVLDADIGASLGGIIRDELGVTSGLIAIDGVELSDLDFIDIGEHIRPANVVPVVIKSLIFPHDAAERPRMLGSV